MFLKGSFKESIIILLINEISGFLIVDRINFNDSTAAFLISKFESFILFVK